MIGPSTMRMYALSIKEKHGIFHRQSLKPRLNTDNLIEGIAIEHKYPDFLITFYEKNWVFP